MNLVMVAKWIQEGYRKYYYTKKTEGVSESRDKFIISYVMRLGRGGLNPEQIKHLVELETSVPDENGMIQC